MTSAEIHLSRALTLAAQGRFRTAPNPRVGAVVVRPGEGAEGAGRVVGEGYHAEVGGPHAEVVALRGAGEAARGATLYVTLEPCAHHGRTPPCTEAVIAAGIARVVAAHGDPDPRVRGAGFARLREAGIEVEELPPGPLKDRARLLNLPFLSRHLLGRPAVTLKWAMSLDGKIATATGESQWISSPEGREGSLRLREEHDAILVGSGTALADDPRLTRRLGLARGPITRVILDRRLRLSPDARLFEEDGPVLVYARPPAEDSEEAEAFAARVEALTARGATVVPIDILPADYESADCGDESGASSSAANLRHVLADLRDRGVGSVLVEGGAEIHASFVAAGLYDRVRVAVTPLPGGDAAAPGPLGGAGASLLSEAPRLEYVEVEREGPDVIINGYRDGCSQDLSSSAEG